MKIILSFVIIFLLSCSQAISQPVLKPSIGLNSLPPDNAAICNPQCGSYNFNETGLNVGDTIPQFRFYTLNGTPYDALSLLSSVKPLCIIAASYTCPVWRGKIPALNNLFAQYSSQVNFLVVYTCEAHPMNPSISPYSCTVWDPNPASIKYLQPVTYGQRKAVAADMMNNTCSCMTPLNANIPLVIDGPCNEFWVNFGPAPNNAYLIDTNGIVFSKHGWFNQSPRNMSADIQWLLTGIPPGGGSTAGSFAYQTLDSIATGPAGEILYGHGRFINNSDSGVVIQLRRTQENLPSGWGSSLCIDVCLPPDVDTASFYLAARDTQSFTMYFYTNNVPGNGNVRVVFRNKNNFNNQFSAVFYAMTTPSNILQNNTGIPPDYFLSQNYPNPFNPVTKIRFGIPTNEFVRVKVYDLLGKEILFLVNEFKYAGEYSVELNSDFLSSGIYYYSIEAGNFQFVRKMTVLK